MKRVPVLRNERIACLLGLAMGCGVFSPGYSAPASAPADASAPGWTQHLQPLRAEDWELVPASSDQFVLYVSPASAVSQNSSITASVRSEWRDPQEEPHTRIGKFLSSISRVEFNCTTHALRHVSATAYAGNNLTGESSSADAAELDGWNALLLQPLSQQLLGVICAPKQGHTGQ